MSKSVRVCPFCSKVDINKLESVVGKENISIGCVSACRKDKTRFFGRINGVYIITENEEEFFDECK